MKRMIVRTTALSLIVAVLAIPGFSAVKKPVAKKKVPQRVVLGTKQLNGDQAQLGVTYTLGKRDPINVTLDKIEYSVEPVRFGNTLVTPKADEKLLVLHYTLHNCNSTMRGLAWSTIEITAVDANDTNWRYVANVAMEATSERCFMTLKPAQKTKVYTAIIVPAKGEIPKLMMQSSDKLVLRYDIRGKAVKLPAPIADPADPTGATALEIVPAQLGSYYTTRELGTRIDSVEFSSEAFNGKSPRKGMRYAIVKGSVKNNQISKRSLSWSTLKPKMTDTDGSVVVWQSQIYLASRDERLNGDIEPGQELRFRWVFDISEKAVPQTLSVVEGNGRAFVYDLSSVK